MAAIGRALGVPVNVPDRPELSSFALPAIVDRGEVTLAIGTSGAAPVLAQRLRAWLERELHPAPRCAGAACRRVPWPRRGKIARGARAPPFLGERVRR